MTLVCYTFLSLVCNKTDDEYSNCFSLSRKMLYFSLADKCAALAIRCMTNTFTFNIVACWRKYKLQIFSVYHKMSATKPNSLALIAYFSLFVIVFEFLPHLSTLTSYPSHPLQIYSLVFGRSTFQPIIHFNSII